MLKKIFLSLAIIATVALLTHDRFAQKPDSVYAAQVDYFLKIDGVEGESRGEEIEILSWSWGETQAGLLLPAVQSARSAGGGAGKVNFSDFHFETKMNKASPKLMEAVATGKHIPNAVLIGLRPGENEGKHQFMKIELTDVLVTSYQTGGSSSDVPMESFSLNFSKIEYEYKTQGSDGSEGEIIKFGWDVKANKAL